MAIITKGILGPIKGKIGKVYGYQRLGKNIIQSCPVSEGVNTRFPVWTMAYPSKYWSYQWNVMSTVQKNSFNQHMAVNESQYDCFIRINKLVADYSVNRNTVKAMFIAGSVLYLFDYTCVLNQATKVITVTLNKVQVLGVPNTQWLIYNRLHYGNLQVATYAGQNWVSNAPKTYTVTVNQMGLYNYNFVIAIQNSISGVSCYFAIPLW